jgi:pyruvate/2-oxoglutarate dehydrogenase complex dihydrolipoamide acyltransferase (E2) component
MTSSPVVFAVTGTVQTFAVPASGTFVVEAAGAQGGNGAAPGLPGARVSGMFHLRHGEQLKIVVGRRGLSGAVGVRGGDSLVWTGADLPNPIKLLLSARGGAGGSAPGADGAPDTGSCEPGDPAIDRGTATALATQWTAGSAHEGAAAARIDRCGYNAGSFRRSTPGAQLGNGTVTIKIVDLAAPAAPPAAPAAAPAAPPEPAPAPSAILPVTPRPSSWASMLRRRPGADKDAR